ncbi:MAG: nucleoside recognition domain-containing protein [Anaerovoracaceae bacterium]
MTKLLIAIKDGGIKGVKTGAMLLKVMLPIYLLVVLLKYSPVMPWLEQVFSPLMRIFNLPPDAAIAIITGFFTDEYGCVAAMSGFSFGTATITTIAMVNLMAHSIPVESAIAQKIGFSATRLILFRIGMAIVAGILVGWLGGIFL